MVSALSTIGSVAGTIATAFFLIDWIGSINRTVILLGTVIAALALLLIGWSGASRFMRLAGALAFSLVLAGCIAFRGPAAIHERLTGDGTRVVFERDSPYHHVRVLDHGGARDLLIDRTVQSRLYLNDSNLRGLEYPEYLHVARLLRSGLHRILFIGLGGGTHARQFTTFYPDTTADVVEIDPLIVSAAKNYFDVRESARLRIHVGDGRVFLRSDNGRYDLISIDAYTRGKYGSTIPPHLVTREFFQEAARHLTDEGIVHIHIYASRHSLFTRSVYRTMTAEFSSVIVLGESELMASNSQLAADADDLMAGAASIRARLPRIDDRIATLRRPLPDPSGVTVLTDDYAPVDTLLREQH
jgi:spermidine synthase